MKVLWQLVGCLQYLVVCSVVSSSSQCDWNDLEVMEFYPGTIHVRTKAHEEKGELSLMLPKKFTYSLNASSVYTLNMTFSEFNCSYFLLNEDGNKINDQSVFLMNPPLTVYGQNLQWSPADCEEMETTSTTITTKKTTPETTTTRTTTPETTTPTTTTPKTTTTPQTTTTTTPKTTTTTIPKTTTTTTPRTTTLGKKTPTSTSSQRNKNQGTTTTTTTTTKPNTSRVVTISIMVFVFLACGLGLCFIYRHRIHSGALDLYTKARLMREDAQNQNQHEVMTVTETPV